MYFSASRLGFFDQNLGKDFVEITKDEHNRLLKKISEGYILSADKDGKPVVTAPAAAATPTIAETYKTRLSQLNVDYEAAGEVIRGSYPLTETTTWPVQLSEAKLYDAWVTGGKKGTAPLTPFLTDLTARREAYKVGSGLEDLVKRIIANDLLYSPAIAEVTAARHAAEQALSAAYLAGDAVALKAVTWNLTKNLTS